MSQLSELHGGSGTAMVWLETEKKGDALLPDLSRPPLPPALPYLRLFKNTNL